MKFPPELIKGTTKNLILAVIAGEELYGYQIIKAIQQKSADALVFGEGSMYPALHALERDGLISSNWVAQDGAPDRKYYRLTKKGKVFLKANINEWAVFSTAVNKVFSGAQFSPC